MTIPSSLPSLAFGAVLLALQAGPAAAHNFTVQNCTGQSAAFNSYNEGDTSLISAYETKHLEDGASGSLSCNTATYCRVQAIDSFSPAYRVSSVITFYSHRDYVRSIDADCSGS